MKIRDALAFVVGGLGFALGYAAAALARPVEWAFRGFDRAVHREKRRR